MTVGRVNRDLDAIVPLELVPAAGPSKRVDAAIDTGFNGYLSMPSALCDELGLELHSYAQALLADDVVVTLARHVVRVVWFGQPRELIAVRADGIPMIGMALLVGSRLTIDVKRDGEVRITQGESASN